MFCELVSVFLYLTIIDVVIIKFTHQNTQPRLLLHIKDRIVIQYTLDLYYFKTKSYHTANYPASYINGSALYIIYAYPG